MLRVEGGKSVLLSKIYNFIKLYQIIRLHIPENGNVRKWDDWATSRQLEAEMGEECSRIPGFMNIIQVQSVLQEDGLGVTLPSQNILWRAA
jgi:hypothetical protein